MTPALAIRFTLVMTLTPDAGYPEVPETMLGDLVLIPWQRPRQGPAGGLNLLTEMGITGTAHGEPNGPGDCRTMPPDIRKLIADDQRSSAENS